MFNFRNVPKFVYHFSIAAIVYIVLNIFSIAAIVYIVLNIIITIIFGTHYALYMLLSCIALIVSGVLFTCIGVFFAIICFTIIESHARKNLS